MHSCIHRFLLPFPHITPAREQHDKQSIRYGVDSVEYKNASPADYHIGVYAMANTTFSITASVQCGPDRARSIRLVNGLPQSGSLTGDQSQQEYKFHVTEFMDHLTVSVARTFGDPDIYIRNDGETAGVGHYMWSSVNTGEDIVVISKANDGAKWCLDCDYSIVVVSSSPSTSYSITASTSSSSPDSKTSTMLQMGVSKMDNVAENRFKFYSFQLDHADAQGEITITVTPFGRGDPDLYVSTSNEFPNTTATATWEGRRMEADSVTIPSTDKKFCTAPCTYYIGVKGSSDCTYSVLVTYDTPTRLVKGVSQRGAVAQGKFR